jgi:hypothetical protein
MNEYACGETARSEVTAPPSTYYVGFTFTDNLWGSRDVGEIIDRTEGGRWEVRWESEELDHTFETDASIREMIDG